MLSNINIYWPLYKKIYGVVVLRKEGAIENRFCILKVKRSKIDALQSRPFARKLVDIETG